MTVRLLLDMNVSAEWISELSLHGWDAIHWVTVGDPRADDATIMAWALANRYVVFTNDLDFGTILALTQAAGPSVLQIRNRNVLLEDMGPKVIAALQRHESEIAAGALVVVDSRKVRVRLLPL